MQTSLSRNSLQVNPTDPRECRVSGTSTIKRLVERLLLRCVEVERIFVAAFWLNPELGSNAAADAGLSVESFGDRRLGVIFFYLCRCVELDINSTVAGCLAVLDHYEPGLVTRWESDWIIRLVRETPTEAGKCDHYANRLRHLSEIRQVRATDALAEFSQLACGDDYDVSVTPRRREQIQGWRSRGHLRRIAV